MVDRNELLLTLAATLKTYLDRHGCWFRQPQGGVEAAHIWQGRCTLSTGAHELSGTVLGVDPQGGLRLMIDGVERSFSGGRTYEVGSMILELDCGNELDQVARVEPDSGVVVAQGASSSSIGLLSELTSLALLRISKARLVSVRSDRETAEICSRISDALGVKCSALCPRRSLAG